MTKLIFACDIHTDLLGSAIIEKVHKHIDVVKVGLKAMTAGAAYGGSLADAFAIRAGEMCDKEIMWDMKIHDVANTMRAAARNIVRKKNVSLFTFHATASPEAIAAVAEESAGKAIALAVTVLTDLDDEQCKSLFAGTATSAVVRFAKRVHSLGIRGFVCSGREARIIRDTIPDAYIVTPGIRPLWAVTADEQKRVTTPTQAKQAGVDAIVVGRPIYNPPPQLTEATAAHAIKLELAAA